MFSYAIDGQLTNRLNWLRAYQEVGPFYNMQAENLRATADKSRMRGIICFIDDHNGAIVFFDKILVDLK